MARRVRWRRRRATYWLVEAETTTLEVAPVGIDGAITLTIRGPLRAVTLRPDGVARRTLPELRLDHLRVADGHQVVERLRRWAVDRDGVAVSLGCLIDQRGVVRAPTLSGVIADDAGNDIVFGDADLTSR
jgi:hypothetical protein